MSIDLGHIARLRSEIAAAARRMLDGECSYVEGSRIILSCLHGARIDNLQEPFVRFVAIDSETDYVKVGAQREGWTVASLEQLDREWAKSEQWARNFGEEACREAISWIERNPIDFR